MCNYIVIAKRRIESPDCSHKNYIASQAMLYAQDIKCIYVIVTSCEFSIIFLSY